MRLDWTMGKMFLFLIPNIYFIPDRMRRLAFLISIILLLTPCRVLSQKDEENEDDPEPTTSDPDEEDDVPPIEGIKLTKEIAPQKHRMPMPAFIGERETVTEAAVVTLRLIDLLG